MHRSPLKKQTVKEEKLTNDKLFDVISNGQFDLLMKSMNLREINWEQVDAEGNNIFHQLNKVFFFLDVHVDILNLLLEKFPKGYVRFNFNGKTPICELNERIRATPDGQDLKIKLLNLRSKYRDHHNGQEKLEASKENKKINLLLHQANYFVNFMPREFLILDVDDRPVSNGADVPSALAFTNDLRPSAIFPDSSKPKYIQNWHYRNITNVEFPYIYMDVAEVKIDTIGDLMIDFFVAQNECLIVFSFKKALKDVEEVLRNWDKVTDKHLSSIAEKITSIAEKIMASRWGKTPLRSLLFIGAAIAGGVVQRFFNDFLTYVKKHDDAYEELVNLKLITLNAPGVSKEIETQFICAVSALAKKRVNIQVEVQHGIKGGSLLPLLGDLHLGETLHITQLIADASAEAEKNRVQEANAARISSTTSSAGSSSVLSTAVAVDGAKEKITRALLSLATCIVTTIATGIRGVGYGLFWDIGVLVVAVLINKGMASRSPVSTSTEQTAERATVVAMTTPTPRDSAPPSSAPVPAPAPASKMSEEQTWSIAAVANDNDKLKLLEKCRKTIDGQLGGKLSTNFSTFTYSREKYRIFFEDMSMEIFRRFLEQDLVSCTITGLPEPVNCMPRKLRVQASKLSAELKKHMELSVLENTLQKEYVDYLRELYERLDENFSRKERNNISSEGSIDIASSVSATSNPPLPQGDGPPSSIPR